VIACGALAHELLAIVDLNGLSNVTIECLPASLHNRPKEIPDAVRARIERARRSERPGQHLRTLAPITPTHDELRVLRAEIDAHSSHITSVESDHDPIHDELRVLRADIDAHGSHITSVESDNDPVHDELRVQRADIDAHSSHITSVESDNDPVHDELRVLRADIDAHSSHITSVESDHDPIHDELRVLRADIDAHSSQFDSIFVAYADCGTGGLLQQVCAEEGVEMLSGAHCYEFFATAPRFAEIQDAEIGSFYLTDFLVRHFDRMVWNGLGLDRHPELLPMYFGNYTRLVYLAQTNDPELLAAAEVAAERLGLTMLVEHTAYGELETTMVELTGRHA
jgi:hypothetical protein